MSRTIFPETRHRKGWVLQTMPIWWSFVSALVGHWICSCEAFGVSVVTECRRIWTAFNAKLAGGVMEHRIPKRDLRREIGSKVRSWFFLEKIVDPYCVERNSPRGQPARMASAVRGLIGYLARFDKLQHQRANTALESQKGRTRCNRGSFLCVCGPVGVLEVQCCTFGQCESDIPFLNWKGSRRGNLHFWPTFPGAVRICCIREGPVHSFFSHPVRFPSSLFFCSPATHATKFLAILPWGSFLRQALPSSSSLGP